MKYHHQNLSTYLVCNIPIKKTIFLTTLENKLYIDKPNKEYLYLYTYLHSMQEFSHLFSSYYAYHHQNLSTYLVYNIPIKKKQYSLQHLKTNYILTNPTKSTYLYTY